MNAMESATVGMGTRPNVNAIVTGQSVTKTFAAGSVVALSGADFEIEKGSFVSLVGPSGCGKSTLLRLISGLIEPSSGSVNVKGEDVVGPRDDVGLMFQKATLLEWRTALENVLLPTEVKRKITHDDEKHAYDLLKLVGLEDFVFSFPLKIFGTLV